MAAEAAGARKVVKLPITGAFHSPLVGSAVDALRPAVEAADWQEPTTPFMSTVTAQIEPAERLGGILLDQLTAPVKFTQAVKALVADGVGHVRGDRPGQGAERPDQAL